MTELSHEQLEQFREKLSEMKRTANVMLAEVEASLYGSEPSADAADRATHEEDLARGIQQRIRLATQISEISCALARIDAGEYGMCELSGEPIEIGRLKANPIARHSVAALEAIETKRRQYAA